MRIIKLAWVGTRTDNTEPTVAFFRDVLGLPLELDRPGFWMLKLPDGSKVEVFGPDTDVNRHFATGPVAGFLVDARPGRTYTQLPASVVRPRHGAGLGGSTLSSGSSWSAAMATHATNPWGSETWPGR
jgi:hypothetical protein